MNGTRLALWAIGGTLVVTGVLALINAAIVKNGGDALVPNPLWNATQKLRQSLTK